MKMPSAYLQCPLCEEVIEVPIVISFVTPSDKDDDGRYQTMVCEPDLADIWSHAWNHSAEEAG